MSQMPGFSSIRPIPPLAKRLELDFIATILLTMRHYSN